MTNFHVDIAINDHGMTLDTCWGVTLSNGIINIYGNNGYNTKAGIELTSTGGYDSFSNIIFGHTAGSTNLWKYGIEETTSSQDYNAYSALVGYECTTATLRKLGANSKADADSIIGAIVTS